MYNASFASFSHVRVYVKGTRNGICYRCRFKFYTVSILNNIFTIFTYQLLRQKQGTLLNFILKTNIYERKLESNLL